MPPALLAGARHLHIGSYYLLDRLRTGLPELVGAARAAGATVSVDPQEDTSGTWDGGLPALLPELDVLFVNEEEARRLDSRACPLVVVKRGADGATARTADGERVAVRGSPSTPSTPPAPATASTPASWPAASPAWIWRVSCAWPAPVARSPPAAWAAPPPSRRWSRRGALDDPLRRREPVGRPVSPGSTTLRAGDIHRPTGLTVVPGGKGPRLRVRAAAMLGGAVTAAALLAGHAGRFCRRAAGGRGRARSQAVWAREGETRTSYTVAPEVGPLTEFYERGDEVVADVWADFAALVRRLAVPRPTG